MVYVIPFATVAVPTTLVATLLAIRELRYQPTCAPTRVAEEIERNNAERYVGAATPAGESIDEIFGVLPGKEDGE